MGSFRQKKVHTFHAERYPKGDTLVDAWLVVNANGDEGPNDEDNGADEGDVVLSTCKIKHACVTWHAWTILDISAQQKIMVDAPG